VHRFGVDPAEVAGSSSTGTKFNNPRAKFPDRLLIYFLEIAVAIIKSVNLLISPIFSEYSGDRAKLGI
jgi:hypothetical protein